MWASYRPCPACLLPLWVRLEDGVAAAKTPCLACNAGRWQVYILQIIVPQKAKPCGWNWIKENRGIFALLITSWYTVS
jgi:hypothetical protein